MKFRPVRPGHCPCCQASCVAPETGGERTGCWDGGARGDTRITRGGSIFAINCVTCGCVLLCFTTGRWEPSLTETAHWYSDGVRVLIGGDRWRGRPQSWQPEQLDSHVARLNNLIETAGSVKEAVLILHTTTGIGAIDLVTIVAHALKVSAYEAKKRVVNSLSPVADEPSG